MPKPEEIFSARAKIIRGTGKAVLFNFDESDEDIWIPLSQIHDPEGLYEQDGLRIGANVEVKLSAWIAKKVGLRS